MLNEIWSTQLAGLLSGDALDVFSSVPAEAARSYAQVKEAILARFEVNAETYHLCFHSTRRKMGESYKMLLSHLSDQLNRWTQSSGSELKENILFEQFLQSLPTDLQGFIEGAGGPSPPPPAKVSAPLGNEVSLFTIKLNTVPKLNTRNT